MRSAVSRILLSGSTVTVPQGLVGWWPMSAQSVGGAQTRDYRSAASTGGFDGILTGTALPVIAPGKIRQGLKFDGTTSRVIVPARQWPQAGYTAMIWAFPTSLAANSELIECYSAATPTAAYSQFVITSAGAVFSRIHQLKDVTYIGRQSSAGDVVTGAWHHIAFTWDGGTTNAAIKNFVNGVQKDTTDVGGGAFSAAYTGSDVQLWIGAQKGVTPPTQLFTGTLEDARIYNRVLSADEILLTYRAGLAGRY